MSTDSLIVSLLCWHTGGSPVDPSIFPGRLTLPASQVAANVVIGTNRWQASRVEFPMLNLDRGLPEPHGEFSQRATKLLSEAASFLAAQDTSVFAQFAASSLRLELLLETVTTQDQLEVLLPSALLLACGSLGLDLHIISND